MKARQAIQGHKDVKGLYRPELFLSLARAVWNQDAPLRDYYARPLPLRPSTL